MSAEQKLYELACQDMPVTGEEVRQAMDAYAHELAQQIRVELDQHDTAARAADLIDPEVS